MQTWAFPTHVFYKTQKQGCCCCWSLGYFGTQEVGQCPTIAGECGQGWGGRTLRQKLPSSTAIVCCRSVSLDYYSCRSLRSQISDTCAVLSLLPPSYAIPYYVRVPQVNLTQPCSQKAQFRKHWFHFTAGGHDDICFLWFNDNHFICEYWLFLNNFVDFLMFHLQFYYTPLRKLFDSLFISKPCKEKPCEEILKEKGSVKIIGKYNY